MCTIVIEALTPLDRTSCIKMCGNKARSRLFCRIAKRSISKYSKFSKKVLSCRIMIFAKSFKGLIVYSIDKESAFYLLKTVVNILIRCQSPFFENLLYFDIAGEQQKCCF